MQATLIAILKNHYLTLMPSIHAHLLKSIKSSVLALSPQAKVILYGSRARGDAHEQSDWDLLILTPEPVSVKDEQQFRHHLFDLELEYGQAFSVMVRSQAEWKSRYAVTSLYANIAKEGIAV
ncbi:nucleotidyltransferase domain-containing protein [Pontibacter sp. G13]|uniref:nucleotidyltransferase domain-containing protein n=1 Tax=Pontibacter sp. G13 TaxID=3074898 RepID=UPI00288B6A71|nr:nucleotidyltransferase domain-containing protein [Pontibacter sp. G13]WNJ20702.1 nucleotidyltransferase domain-containing protein [Pontibacter sp. G13]